MCIGLDCVCIGRTSYYDAAMGWAANRGHMAVVRPMLEKGARDYNLAMIEAVRGNHIDVVALMLDLGATDYDLGKKEALRCRDTHQNIPSWKEKIDLRIMD